MDPRLLGLKGRADEFRRQAVFCKTMGHPVRLLILESLHRVQGEVSCTELLALTGVAKPSLSQHLARMQAVGLVHLIRRGRFLFVELAASEVGKACEMVKLALECARHPETASRGNGATAAEFF